MKKYLYDYIKEIDDLLLKEDKIKDEEIEKHLTKISFFQHERLIHLLVTLFYTLFFLIFSALGFVHFVFKIITVIILIFLICYIIHYLRLENGVQYLYKQYDKMLEKKKIIKGGSL